MEQQSYLTDLEFTPVRAGSGKRFLNYVIDIIVYYLILYIVIIGVYVASGTINFSSGDTGSELLFRLFLIVFYVVYMFLFETIFKGKTVGKFITGTRAVNEDGTEMAPKTVMLRTLSRLVPFEPFSALGSPSAPWHDRWTHTCVIDVKKSTLNN